jgi:hypothetical protein
VIISDKRKLVDGDNYDNGESRKGDAKELVASPMGPGRPGGFSVMGMSGNTLPVNDALGEPWPLGWRISLTSANSEPIGPQNPSLSMQRALLRAEQAKLVNLQKGPMLGNDDADDFDESKIKEKVNLPAVQEKEKEKEQPMEKGTFEFFWK